MYMIIMLCMFMPLYIPNLFLHFFAMKFIYERTHTKKLIASFIFDSFFSIIFIINSIKNPDIL